MSEQEQIWAVSMFRDEEDVADHVIKHLIDEGVDGIIIADNLSSDGTRDKILSCVDYAVERGCRLILEIDDELGYYQSEKMTKLANQAHGEGASWIVPFDADEIWFSREDRLAPFLRGLQDHYRVVNCSITNHFPSSLDKVGNPFEVIEWRQPEAQALPKVAFRWEEGCVIHQGNHGVTLKEGYGITGGLELRHFPYRSFEHFKRKAINGKQAYDASNLPEDMGLHWRQYGQVLEQSGEDALREVFETYFWFLAPLNAGLVLDPAPFRRWN
jgi:hypothetical protein